jgi:hypothetical protein
VRALPFAFAVALFCGPLFAEQTDPIIHLKGLGGTIEAAPLSTEAEQVGAGKRFEASTPVELVITRFSSDDERDHFVAGGIPVLAGMPIVGQVTVGGNPACAIRYAGKESLGSSTRLTLITDYVVGVGGRGGIGAKKAAAYPVTIVSLMLDAKGQGGGSLGGTRSISYDPIAKRIIAPIEDQNSLFLSSLHQVPK